MRAKAPPTITVVEVPIDDLRQDAANPRRIGDAELEALTRSVRQYGLVQPILARGEDNTVIRGHQRLLAARLDAPTESVAIWGSGEEVIWIEGEPAMVYGPTGTGKTTLLEQLVLASVGVRAPELLGQLVAPRRRWLYLALDRPAQIKRSFKRMVSESDRAILDDRLVFHDGPLDFDVGQEPERLLALAQEVDADTVTIDSLKDAAGGLEKSEVGQAVNRAHQLLVSNGIELIVNHHPRKAQVGNSKPKTIDDVFGSCFIVDGCGSVILLWGAPGDAIVELSHLKQPRDSVGPWTLVHDHEAGVTTLDEKVDAFTIITASKGISAEGIARQLFKTERPTRAQTENARRKAQSLAKKGFATERAGTTGGKDGGSPALFFRVDSVHAPFTDRPSSDSKSVHESVHGVHAPTVHVSALSIERADVTVMSTR